MRVYLYMIYLYVHMYGCICNVWKCVKPITVNSSSYWVN